MLPHTEIPFGPGVHTLYWNNGNIRSSFVYILNLQKMILTIKDGTYKTYYEDGTIKSQTTYKNNQLDGKCIYYNIKGEPEEIVLYNNGNIDHVYRKNVRDPSKLALVPMTN